MLDKIKLISEIKTISNDLLFLSFNEIKNRLDRIVRNYEDSERILQILKNVKEKPVIDEKICFNEYLKVLKPDFDCFVKFENNEIKYTFDNSLISKDVEETIRKKMSESKIFNELKEYFEKNETFEEFQNMLLDLDSDKHIDLLKNIESYNDFFNSFRNIVNLDGKYECVACGIFSKEGDNEYKDWGEES